MNQRRKKKNWLEWSVFAMGLLLVTALVGYLGYDIATSRSTPPEIEVTLGETVPQNDHYMVPVAVRNRGHQVAEQVHVEVILREGDETEKANLMIQYLPRGSTRRGAVTFTFDPATADQLATRVLGYQQP